MVSPELTDYIRNGVKEGFALTDIVEALLAAGWEKQDIRTAIQLLQQEGMAITIPPLLVEAALGPTRPASPPSEQVASPATPQDQTTASARPRPFHSQTQAPLSQPQPTPVPSAPAEPHSPEAPSSPHPPQQAASIPQPPEEHTLPTSPSAEKYEDGARPFPTQPQAGTNKEPRLPSAPFERVPSPSLQTDPSSQPHPTALVMPKTPQEAQAFLAHASRSSPKSVSTGPVAAPSTSLAIPDPATQPPQPVSPTPTPPLPSPATPPSVPSAGGKGGFSVLLGILLIAGGVVLGAILTLGGVCIASPEAFAFCSFLS